MIGWMLDGAVDWLNGIVGKVLDAAWKLLTATLFHIPDVTGLPQVQTLTSRSLMVVNTAYVLVIIAAGIVVMTAGTVQARYGAQELLPRLVLGIVVANLAVWISKTIVSAGNALVVGLTGQGIASDGSLQQLLRVMTSTLSNPVIGLLSAIIGLIIAVLVLLLISGWITRFAALIVLCGIAPIALACHGLPWTEALALLWWKAMGGVVAAVVLQSVALNVSLAIYLDPDSNLPAMWLPLDPTGLLNLLIIACLLWFAVRLPGMVRRFVTQSGNKQNVMGAIVRLVIVQQLTRGLRRALSTARNSAAGAGGAAGAQGRGGGTRGPGGSGGRGSGGGGRSGGGGGGRSGGGTGGGRGGGSGRGAGSGQPRRPSGSGGQGASGQGHRGSATPRPGTPAGPQPAGPQPAGPRGTGWPGWRGPAGGPVPSPATRPQPSGVTHRPPGGTGRTPAAARPGPAPRAQPQPIPRRPAHPRDSRDRRTR